jgi:uncharacterized delta-60 repeat protein
LLALGGGGRIVVAGSNATSYTSDEWDIALAALRGDGSLDRQFGQGGKAISSFAPTGGHCSRHTGFIEGMALDSRGRIVVDGECMRDQRPGVARFKPSGELDRSFGANGVVNRDLGIYRTEALAIDNRDRIDVMGVSGHAWVVSRLRSDGRLDRSFGKKGRAHAAWGKSDRGTHVTDGAVDSHGRIVLGGSHGFGFGFARFKPDGHLNRRFGDDGQVVVKDPNRRFHLDLTGAVAIDKRDRIVGAGARRRAHHSGTHLALVRLLG